MAPVALSLLAHPDDAEILCAGTLLRLAERGWTIHIATVCRGDCGSATLDADEIARIRDAEARRAASLTGATYHNLDEPDGYVIYDASTSRKTVDLFREVNPSLVFTHPVRDYMLDHEQVSLLARAATFLFPVRNASSKPVPRGAAIPHLYYCDPIGGANHRGDVIEPSTVIDITDVQERKLGMLACHASQRSWLAAHHGMDEYLHATRRHDAERGKLIGVRAAEAFVQHRGHAYPGNDLLRELFFAEESTTHARA